MTPHQLHRAARLWTQGNDTHRIAERLGVSEGEVWNNLDLMKYHALRMNWRVRA